MIDQESRMERAAHPHRHFVGMLLTYGLAGLAAGQDVLTPKIALELKTVRDVAIDPSGERIAYVVSLPRGEDDDPGDNHSEIWITDFEGRSARRYTRTQTRASSPRWSPDGRQIAFLAKRTERSEETQIFALPIAGGEAEMLSEHQTSISDFRWSPDGASILFTASDPKSDAEEEDDEAGRDWTVVDQNLKHTRLWILDVAGGESRPAYDGKFSIGGFTWIPGSEALALQASLSPRTDDAMMYSGIYAMPCEGVDPAPVCQTKGKLGSMAASPDGMRLAFLGATSLNDPLSQSLFVVDLPSGVPRNLTPDLEASASDVAWIDENTLLLAVTEGCRSKLVRIDAAGGKPEELVSAPVLFSFELHAATGRIAAAASAPGHPSELFVGSVSNGKLRRITHSNPRLDSIRVAKQEVIDWKATDGLHIQGVLTYPVGYESGKPYPLIVNPHGGPEGTSMDGWNTWPQLLAAHGYVVLQPNYRGSGGRGIAFAKGDHNDLGGKEFQDILAGVDRLVQRGIADPKRVGMGGWSYGGYLSALAATHHSERFKAAVMGAGICNWLSFMGTTDIPHEMSLVHWNQWGYDDPAMYWDRSPLSRIDKAKTPTLILHGEKDVRVSPGQAWEMYTALKTKGVPTQLVLYPRSGHGVSERAHRLDLYTRQLEWFDQYLK